MWGKLILIIYVLSIAFSIVALSITIYALETWPFAYEWAPSTRWLFTHFGLLGGAFLIRLWILVDVLAVPLVFVIFLRWFSRDMDTNSFIQNTFVCLVLAFIDGWAFSSISSSFLDMYNDILVLHLIISGNIIDALSLDWLRNLAVAIGMPVFLTSLFLSFSVRLGWYLRNKSRHAKVNRINSL